jgi:hypothetical protein
MLVGLSGLPTTGRQFRRAFFSTFRWQNLSIAMIIARYSQPARIQHGWHALRGAVCFWGKKAVAPGQS